MKKFLLFLTLFLSAVGIATAEATSATIDLTKQGWSSQKSMNNVEISVGTCKVVFSKANGTEPKYFTNDAGNAVRMYYQNILTISAPENYYITKITVTGVNSSSKDCSFTYFALNSETEKGLLTIATDKKSGTWVCGSDKPLSVAFKSNTSKKQVWVQTISITIEPLASDPTDCGLKFDAETANVTFGTTPYTLPSLTKPKGVTVKWSSSDETVAKFDAENNIEILKAGTTIIKAELADEGTAYTKNTSASYTLTVAKGTPNFAYASATYDYVMQAGGAGFSAPALNKPDGLAVTYVSSNTEVATVDENTGVITPVTRGKAVITATGAENDCWNGATATLTVNITKNIPVLTFSNTEVTKYIDELSAYKGETLTTDPADLEINYSVSPAEIASIDSKSGELTFTGATGVATITAVSTETATHESKSATYTVSVSKRNPALAFDETAVELLTTDTYAGQEVKYTLLEGLAEGFTINYETNNSSVANVNALTGAVTLTGAEGTATITAYGSGNTYYTDGSATYTIKVAKQYIWSDTKAVLVTKYSDLKAGDVIIIANPTEGYIMTNAAVNSSSTYFTAATITDLNTIPSNAMLLQYVEYETGKYALRTLNHAGSSQGYITIHSSASSTTKTGKGYVRTTAENNAIDVNISIASETSKATISFGTNADIFIKLNAISGLNPPRFAGYTASSTSQKDVYIYKVVIPKTIEAQLADEQPKFVESSVKLTNIVQLSEEATANNYAVLINGIQVGVFAKDSHGDVTIELTNAPYLPEAKYTICPVLAEDAEGNPTTLGHPEELTFTFPTLPTFEVTAKTPKWYYSKFYTEDGETYANLDLWIYMTPSVTTTLGYTFAEFDNSVAGTEIWGWYDENKDQLQNCKYNFLTKVPVTDNIPVVSEELLKGKVATATFTPVFLFNVDSKYSSLISGSTRAAAPALLAEGAPILVQEVNGTKISESIEVSELIGALVSGVESVVVEGVDGAVEYYNMQGVRVEGELAPGMYIRRQGRSVSKVQIR